MNHTTAILFATMTGNSRDLAEKTHRRFEKEGLPALAIDMAGETPESLKEYSKALFIVSTWGEGEPPDDAVDYVERLMSDEPLDLAHLEFSVCGLGDTGYEIFCGCGKAIDSRLEHHGARRIVPRVDCDVDYYELFETWLEAVVQELKSRVEAVA